MAKKHQESPRPQPQNEQKPLLKEREWDLILGLKVNNDQN
jgi:hypothetical protein